MPDSLLHLSVADMRRNYAQAAPGARVALVSTQAAAFQRRAADLHCATRTYQPSALTVRPGGLLEGVALAHKVAASFPNKPAVAHV